MRSIVLALILGPASWAIAQPAEPAVPPNAPPTPTAAPPPEAPLAPAEALPAPAPDAATPAPSAATPAKGTTEKAAPAMAVTYDKGIAFETADKAFGLRLAFRNQLRFESLRATEDHSQFQSKFSITRARFQVEGHVFGNDTRYKLEFALDDVSQFAFVRDLFLDQRLGRTAWLRAGQWKRPFNRQELVADFASEFNERANTAAFVGGGRDLGVAVHNDYERSPEGLEWAIGVFNGFSGGADRPVVTTTCTQNTSGAISCTTPPPSSSPTDFGPAIVARVGWNIGKIKGYSEGDLEGGPLRAAIGASYKIDLANFAKRKEDTVADNMSHGVEVDLMLKAQGFGLELGMYLMKLKSADAQRGFFVQPGYFVVPKRLQVAGRFAYAPLGNREQIEARAAFNVYWQGHAWKWANDVGVLKLTGEDPMTMTTDKPDVQVRSMLQLTL
jgi:hypothetical protein